MRHDPNANYTCRVIGIEDRLSTVAVLKARREVKDKLEEQLGDRRLSEVKFLEYDAGVDAEQALDALKIEPREDILRFLSEHPDYGALIVGYAQYEPETEEGVA